MSKKTLDDLPSPHYLGTSIETMGRVNIGKETLNRRILDIQPSFSYGSFIGKQVLATWGGVICGYGSLEKFEINCCF